MRPKRASTNRSSSGRQSQDHPGNHGDPRCPRLIVTRNAASFNAKVSKDLLFQFASCRICKDLGGANARPGLPGGDPGDRNSAASKFAPASALHLQRARTYQRTSLNEDKD